MVVDGKHIASFIASPDGLKQENLTEIDELLAKFPYSSSLYILQLKALANSNSLLFEEKLKVAAAHVNDRAHLYELIQSDSSTESVLELEEENPVEQPPVSEEEEEVIETAINSEAQDDSIETEITATEIEEEEENPEIEIADELTAQIMSEAISSAFEHSTDELIETPTTQLPEEEITKKETLTEEANLTTAPANEAALTSDSEPIQDEILPQEVSFIEWLKLKKDGTTPIKSDSTISEKKETESTQKTEEKKPSNKMSKREINALLDRFIAEQPSMKKPSKDFFKPSDYAKESIEESNENVTETLAQIHVMQGNYQKAITAYKQLSLLYPEKKAFFASQIKELEDKIS